MGPDCIVTYMIVVTRGPIYRAPLQVLSSETEQVTNEVIEFCGERTKITQTQSRESDRGRM
jgi:hypothetical protein